MTAAHLLPADRPNLITLELGAACYGVMAIAHQHPLEFEPLPAGVFRADHVCGLVRLRDGSAVPVFGLRSSGNKAGHCRLLIATGYHDEDHSVSMAFMIDAAPPACPRERAFLGAASTAFERN